MIENITHDADGLVFIHIYTFDQVSFHLHMLPDVTQFFSEWMGKNQSKISKSFHHVQCDLLHLGWLMQIIS
jgi:hypothetical protein